jgi:phosphoribosylformimino-5-aminoimidazole carboxamide ribotide isomerase
MLLIPAVDLKNGRCVRLRQGQMDAETVYSDDPLAMAQRWVDQGASWLHIGIRTIDRIEGYLGVGVARVILGTLAIEQPLVTAELCRRFPERIAVSLDVRDGTVALKGWQQSAALDYLDVARQIDAWHPAVLIFTAVQRDGTLEGPDLPRLKALLAAVNRPVIVAGGIGQIAHIQSLVPLVAEGLQGAIIGKALYDGSVTFHEALALAQGA